MLVDRILSQRLSLQVFVLELERSIDLFFKFQDVLELARAVLEFQVTRRECNDAHRVMEEGVEVGEAEVVHRLEVFSQVAHVDFHDFILLLLDLLVSSLIILAFFTEQEGLVVNDVQTQLGVAIDDEILDVFLVALVDAYGQHLVVARCLAIKHFSGEVNQLLLQSLVVVLEHFALVHCIFVLSCFVFSNLQNLIVLEA